MRSFKLAVPLALVTCLALGIFTSIALSQDDKKSAAGHTMPSPEEMQAMMEKMGMVGPEHKRLKEQFEGTWNAEVTGFWGPEPDKSTGTMKSEMMFGGRYLHGLFEGTAMGQPFQGASVTGYDNMKQKYFSTWMDSMSTGMMMSEGTYDESSKTYTYSGESIGMDGKPCTLRQILKVESNDKHVFTMYAPGPDGKEMKMMEIVYTRK